MLLMCSCDNELNNIVGGNTSEKAIITTSPYEFEEGTRTVLTNTGSAISFAWDDNEAIGIFPIAPTTNSQAKQVITKKEGSTTTAVFDGAGWELKKGNTYAAYYPYKDMMSSATYDAVPVDYTGQVQDGNGSLAHIGANYDYMYAVSGEPTNGIVNFDLKHIGSVVMLELTMPDAGEWKNLTLTASSKVFVSKATMNVSNGSITATEKSQSMSLDLKNISTTAANQTITLYFATLPTTTGEVKAVVADASGNEYTVTLVSKTFVAGKAYKWEASPKALNINYGEANGHEYVDLGIRKSMYDSSITPGSSADRRVVFATCNIGANSPEEQGYYFRWGELCGWNVEGKNFSLSSSNCKQIVPSDKSYEMHAYVDNTFDGPNTWDDPNWALYKQSGVEDFQGKTNLTCKGQVYGDAARYNWGGNWMMMNYTQLRLFTQQSLRNYTATRTIGSGSNSVVIKYTWTTQNGVYGMKLENESLGTSIFFPASGYCSYGRCTNVGSFGRYWTSTPGFVYDDDGRCLTFDSTGFGYNDEYRHYGYAVRPILELVL